MKCVVTVSRKWDHPNIETTVSGDGIAIRMSLDDFLKALVAEVGTVAFTFRQVTFAAQLDAAAKIVVQGMKDETIKVV